MQTLGKARRVRIYMDEDDRRDGRPLHLAVLELLRAEGAQGATVLRALEGFGAGGQLHATTLADVAARLPLVLEWIDDPGRVDRLLPRVLELVRHGLVTADETEVLLREPHPVRALRAAITVGEVMTREVASVAPDAPVRTVVELMLGRGHRAVPVVEAGRVVGIITNGDLVQRAGLGVRLDLLGKLDPQERRQTLDRLGEAPTAAKVMTPEPVTVRAGTPLPQAAEVMARRRLKRLPVVDEAGGLLGMVSRVDLLRTAAAGGPGGAPEAPALGLTLDAPVARAMRRDVPTVHPETPLPEVLQAVMSTRLGRAFVVDAGRRVVGLVSDAELLERVTPALRPGLLRSLMARLPFSHGREEAIGAHARGHTAAELMGRAFAQVREDVLLAEAVGLVVRERHKVLAVVDADGRLTGMLDRADLLHGLLLPDD
jgi:CBS-domain-containing membrane protein